MCTILGWQGTGCLEQKRRMLKEGILRGRDGGGLEADGVKYQWKHKIPVEVIDKALEARSVVCNFRAIPTTESETAEYQPYDGYVHNGTIANDKEFGDFPIDSMCIPVAVGSEFGLEAFHSGISKLKGSFAIAKIHNNDLFLATNYKPIYTLFKGSTTLFSSVPESMIISGEMNLPQPVKPYSIVCFRSLFSSGMHREQHDLGSFKCEKRKVVLSCSGGLDSVTCAYMLKADGVDLTLAYFKYGCNAEKEESKRVQLLAKELDCSYVEIELPKIMTGTITQGDYHRIGEQGAEYAHDWVSARNLLMMSCLTAYAESNGMTEIAFGGNLEESGSYPDNEMEFGRKFNELLPYSVQNGYQLTLTMPVGNLMKHEIVKEGVHLGVDWGLTWSCYSEGRKIDGERKHCGECGPCFMRKKAFERSGMKDPVMLYPKEEE